MRLSGVENIPEKQNSRDNAENEEMERRLQALERQKEKHGGKKSCLFVILLILAGSVCLIGYFFYYIKDQTAVEYDKWKKFILEPAAETRDSETLDAVENSLNTAVDTVNSLNETYQKTKETYDKAEQAYEQGKEIYEKINN